MELLSKIENFVFRVNHFEKMKSYMPKNIKTNGNWKPWIENEKKDNCA